MLFTVDDGTDEIWQTAATYLPLLGDLLVRMHMESNRENGTVL
jgi:hypothetical protein